jgi:hypothetical protein
MEVKMKISVLQEKLEKAIKMGSKQVVLHEGVLCNNRYFGITGIMVEPNPKNVIICSDNKLNGTPIDKFMSMLEHTKKTDGDVDINGSLGTDPMFIEESDEIKTVCTISYKNEKDEQIMLTLISLTDLTSEANGD